jgi:hypothetical protein
MGFPSNFSISDKGISKNEQSLKLGYIVEYAVIKHVRRFVAGAGRSSMSCPSVGYVTDQIPGNGQTGVDRPGMDGSRSPGREGIDTFVQTEEAARFGAASLIV